MRSVILTLSALAMVSCQNIVSITSPLTGTVYTAGKPALLTWVDAKVSTIPAIVVAHGNASALEPISTIATDVDASTGSYTWNIPSDFISGEQYALEFGKSPNISFSGFFTVKSGDGTSTEASSSVSQSSVSASSTPASQSTVSPSSTSAAQSSVSSSQALSSSSPSSAPSSSASPSANAATGNIDTAISAFAIAMVGSAVLLTV
ncbi:hypothetical protein BC941DRAFT_514342 [Chlamydoabsidia padenii]|nr:hypothetical protein BC941DRAFT_514342 [Chlamydoabsidia padenii]